MTKTLHSPTPSNEIPVVCDIWKSTLFRVVPDGIAVKCKSCRGEIHHISKARLEALWRELASDPQGDTMGESK